MKKAAFVISIVAIAISALTMALTVLEMFYRRTSYIDSDKV